MSGYTFKLVENDRELAEAFSIREKVFCVEQGVSREEELDELDATAVHVLALKGGRPVGTARLVVEGEAGRIGRMAVLAEERQRGVGSGLTRHLEDEARRRGLREVVLHAQTHALGFYRGLGYREEGPVFEEAGISHLKMRKSLTACPRRATK